MNGIMLGVRQANQTTQAPERPEEFSPGLDPELQELADALNTLKKKVIKDTKR